MGMLVINPELAGGRTFGAHKKKLRYFSFTNILQRLFMSPMTAEHMT